MLWHVVSVKQCVRKDLPGWGHHCEMRPDEPGSYKDVIQVKFKSTQLNRVFVLEYNGTATVAGITTYRRIVRLIHG